MPSPSPSPQNEQLYTPRSSLESKKLLPPLSGSKDDVSNGIHHKCNKTRFRRSGPALRGDYDGEDESDDRPTIPTSSSPFSFAVMFLRRAALRLRNKPNEPFLSTLLFYLQKPFMTRRRRVISGIFIFLYSLFQLRRMSIKYFGHFRPINTKGGKFGRVTDNMHKKNNLHLSQKEHGWNQWDEDRSEHESYIGGSRWYVTRSISRGDNINKDLAGGDMLRYLYVPVGKSVEVHDVRMYLRMDVTGISSGYTWPVIVGEDTLGSTRNIMEDKFNNMAGAGDIATMLHHKWWKKEDSRAEDLRCIILVFAYGGACVPRVEKIVSYSLDNLMKGKTEGRNGKKLWAYFNELEKSANEGNKEMIFLASSVAGHATLRMALNEILYKNVEKKDPSEIVMRAIEEEKLLGSSFNSHGLVLHKEARSSSMVLSAGTQSGSVGERCGYSCSVSGSCCDILTENSDQILVVSLSSSVLTSTTKLEGAISHGKSATVSVIAPKILNSPPKLHTKDRTEDRMFADNMKPRWACDRCLRDARRGSFGNCKKECGGRVGKYYYDEICSPERRLPKAEIEIKLRVGFSNKNKTAEEPPPRLIPRIIHQTWKGKITAERQPSLARLQNSWKFSGWDYRYYDDDGAQAFIEQHFPQRIVDAYDALIPGAFKADLFRYLVLMIHGGVYADVDILLEGNLDTLIPPSLGFLAPLDTPGEENDERICLWNGFMASAPGHPFVVRAAERTINHILDRADMFDMEREVCLGGKTNDVECWKMRVERGLVMSGPCALGISVNEALGQPSLKGYDLGWMPSPGIEGTSLILKLDKQDLGSFRLSDTTRQVIVASTNLPDMIEYTVENEDDATEPVSSSDVKGFFGIRGSETISEEEVPKVQHYSEADRGKLIWGAELVYTDLQVVDETMIFSIEKT